MSSLLFISTWYSRNRGLVPGTIRTRSPSAVRDISYSDPVSACHVPTGLYRGICPEMNRPIRRTARVFMKVDHTIRGGDGRIVHSKTPQPPKTHVRLKPWSNCPC